MLSSSPPLPPVTVRTVVQVVPLAEVWIWYAEPYAASQVSLTRSIAYDCAEVDLDPLRVGERRSPTGWSPNASTAAEAG